MAMRPWFLKLYPIFTKAGAQSRDRELSRAESGRWPLVAGIALAMFIALFGWGASYFGWHDPSGKVQLALFTSFILGVVASYKSRG
jgi:hypothetical protein